MLKVVEKKFDDILEQWQWGIPILGPFLLILFSYFFSSWSWGLMDDLQLLENQGTVWRRAQSIFSMYFAFGELKWTHAAHCAFFYKIFADAPGFFHIFKLAEVFIMLFIWGGAAYQVTGRRIVIFLVPAIALSFHYLYDQFFFLSTHETTGLLFLGLAAWCAARLVVDLMSKRMAQCAWLWIAMAACLLSALGAKETFVACGFALGLSMACFGWISRSLQPRHFWSGLVLAGIFVIYGIILKSFVCSAYTAQYSFLDFGRILGNLKAWALKDLLNHTPWIAVIIALCFYVRGKRELYKPLDVWGIILGGLLYGGFLAVLLPWNALSYYAGPLGVFFAFVSAILIAPLLERVSRCWCVFIVIGALAFNVFVAQYALTRESAYHQNTQDLWQWIKGNNDFQQSAKEEKVFCNAMEAAGAIPIHANRWWALGLKSFVWENNGVDAARRNGAQYYVFSKRFGALDESGLRGWQTVFYSQYWQVYRKEKP